MSLCSNLPTIDPIDISALVEQAVADKLNELLLTRNSLKDEILDELKALGTGIFHITTSVDNNWEQRISTLEGQQTVLNDNLAGVYQSTLTFVTNTEAQSIAQNTVLSEFADNLAKINSFEQTIATETQAYATSQQDVMTEFGNIKLTIEDNTTAVAGYFTEWNGVEEPKLGMYRTVLRDSLDSTKGYKKQLYVGGLIGWMDTDGDSYAAAAGWAGEASKFIVDPDTGAMTGWQLVDGSDLESTFRIQADKFSISASDSTIGSVSPFVLDTDNEILSLNTDVRISGDAIIAGTGIIKSEVSNSHLFTIEELNSTSDGFFALSVKCSNTNLGALLVEKGFFRICKDNAVTASANFEVSPENTNVVQYSPAGTNIMTWWITNTGAATFNGGVSTSGGDISTTNGDIDAGTGKISGSKITVNSCTITPLATSGTPNYIAPKGTIVVTSDPYLFINKDGTSTGWQVLSYGTNP